MLLWRAPLLLPLMAVCGVILGGSWGWLVVGVTLLIASICRMRRLVACSLLCALAVSLLQSYRHEQEAQLRSMLREHESVMMEGVIVRTMGKSCLLETGWVGVRVVLRGACDAWLPGDRVRVAVQALPVLQEPVPGMFSVAEWMRGQGICAQLSCLSGEKTGESGGISRWVRRSDRVRQALCDLLMPPGTEGDERRQVLCALVMGEKERAASETMDVFRRGGCLHAFAVSGLHVGLVAGIIALLLRLLRVRPALGRYIILVATALYVFATGMTIPALRAFLMLAVLLGALIMRRRAMLLNTWCFAALFILMVQPWQLWQAGFQLSFVVYAAICLGVRYGMRDRPWFGPDDYIPARIRTVSERMLVRLELGLRGTVIVALCAWLISAPLSISLFHVVTPTSYLTNIAIAPLLPLVMLCGMLMLALGWVPLVGIVFRQAALHSAGWLIGLVSLASDHPAAYLPASDPAPPDAYMLVAMGQYNKSFCILGNPGLLVGDTGREADARYSVEPALFHAGYRPAAWCSPARAEEAAAHYSRTFPAMRRIRYEGAGVAKLTTAAGVYTLYYPEGVSPSAASAQPVVLWQTPQGERILYAGNAGLSAVEQMLPEELNVDILILGSHAGEPPPDAALLAKLSPHRLILLPTAQREQLPHGGTSAPLSIEALQSESRPIIRRGK